MGTEMKTTISMDGSIRLSAEDVNDEEIRWKLELPKTELKVESMMGPIDTTIANGSATAITDRNGVLKSLDGALYNVGPLSMLIGAQGNQEMQMLLMPKLPSDVQAGQSWTVSNTAAPEGTGFETYTVLRYTYQGLVDTLGITSVRIRVQSDTLEIHGELEQAGMNISMEGEGEVNGMLYYATLDGLIVAAEQTTESNMNIMVTGEQSMIIPGSQDVKIKFRRVTQ
jgi:hypothetical protein